MYYTITKLDRRHSWHTQFKWLIEFPKPRLNNPRMDAGVLAFDRSRRWFSEKFGWSQDVDTRAAIKGLGTNTRSSEDYNDLWAYSIKYNDYRIYVRDDATLSWFTLSYPRDPEHEEPLF